MNTIKHQSRLSGAIALMFAQAVVLILGYVAHLWIGRTLGPASYGVFGVVLSIQTIAGLLLTLGVPMAVSRFVARDENHARSTLRQALRIQLALAVIIAAATFALSPLLARLLGDTQLTNLIRFVALVLFLQAGYPIFTQFFSGLHRFNQQAALTSAYALIKLIGALSLIYIFGVYGAFSGFAIGGIAAALIGWYWTRHLGGNTPHKLPLKSFLSFTGTYVLILFGLQLLISLDLFMVKAFLGSDEITGYYSAAVTLSRIPYMLLQSLMFVLLPSVSALTKSARSQRQAVKFIRDTLRYLIALIVPSVMLASATSHSLVSLFYSKLYLPAAPALSILMVGLGMLAFYLLLANIVAGAGKAYIGRNATLLMVALSGILGYFLIPRFGIVGAAWQTTITGLVGLIFLSTYTFHTFKIRFPLKSIVNIFLASLISTSVAFIWTPSNLVLPLQYILLLAFYILILFILGEIKADDRRLVASLHPSLQWLAGKKR